VDLLDYFNENLEKKYEAFKILAETSFDMSEFA